MNRSSDLRLQLDRVFGQSVHIWRYFDIQLHCVRRACI